MKIILFPCEYMQFVSYVSIAIITNYVSSLEYPGQTDIRVGWNIFSFQI